MDKSRPIFPLRILGKLKGKHLAVLGLVVAAIDAVLKVKRVPHLTYAEAVKYFVTHRPDDDRIAKGVLMRHPAPDGSLLVWLFLDGENRQLADTRGKKYGRRLLVKQMDDELVECFANQDLIVIE